MCKRRDKLKDTLVLMSNVSKAPSVWQAVYEEHIENKDLIASKKQLTAKKYNKKLKQ